MNINDPRIEKIEKINSRKNDLTGKTFGHLKVLKVYGRLSGPTYTELYWLCECSCGRPNCAKLRLARCSELKRGKVYNCGKIREPIEWSFVKLKRAIAHNRGIPHKLTMAEILRLAHSDCHYCGAAPSGTFKASLRDDDRRFTYQGVDRKDNTKGYTVDNVVPCCRSCNAKKRTIHYHTYLEKIGVTHA